MQNLSVCRLDLPEIREAYRLLVRNTFPDDERKPLSMIERAVARGRYRCFGAKTDGELAGCAFFAILPGESGTDALLDYLSVREDLRGQGIGGQFLAGLMETEFPAFRTAILEVNDPDFAEGEEKQLRERRLAFYQRCGFLQTAVRANVFHVDYRILRYPLPNGGEPSTVYLSLYQDMLPPALFGKFVSVRSGQA